MGVLLRTHSGTSGAQRNVSESHIVAIVVRVSWIQR